MDVWQRTLTDLRRQMTQAQYDNVLRDTALLRVIDNCYHITVPNTAAHDWLNDRMRPTVEAALTNVVGQPAKLFFVLDPGDGPKHSVALPPPIELPTTPRPAHQNSKKPDETGLASLNFYEAKRQMGYWLPEFDYDRVFWSVYLGRGYDFWRYLVSHWLKQERDKRHRDLSKIPNQGWTPPFRLSYRAATHALGKSNQAIVPGGMYECHHSLARFQMRSYGVPLLERCCGSHQPCRWRTDKSGGGRCHFWRPGLLHQLHNERLLAIELSPAGRASVQVLRVLPLLTPWQVQSGLPEPLREDHDKWLEVFGHHFELEPEQWQAIEAKRVRVRWDEVALQGEPPANPLEGDDDA